MPHSWTTVCPVAARGKRFGVGGEPESRPAQMTGFTMINAVRGNDNSDGRLAGRIFTRGARANHKNRADGSWRAFANAVVPFAPC